MRSRDGDKYRLLAFCSVILFFSLALHAGEFLISYRYVVKDSILYNESLQISSAMTKCDGVAQPPLTLPNKNDNLLEIIKNNSEEFIDFIHKLGMNLNSYDKTLDLQTTTTTIMTLRTTCFKVDFNDNFVKIYPLK